MKKLMICAIRRIDGKEKMDFSTASSHWILTEHLIEESARHNPVWHNANPIVRVARFETKEEDPKGEKNGPNV